MGVGKANNTTYHKAYCDADAYASAYPYLGANSHSSPDCNSKARGNGNARRQ